MSALGDRLRRIPRELPRRAAISAAPAIEGSAKADAPVRTGATRDSITAHAVGGSVVVRANTPHAQYVDGATEGDYTPELDAAVRSLDAV